MAMAEILFTDKQKEFIYRNLRKLRFTKIGEKLGVSGSKIQTFIKKNPTPPWEEEFFNVDKLPSPEHSWIV